VQLCDEGVTCGRSSTLVGTLKGIPRRKISRSGDAGDIHISSGIDSDGMSFVERAVGDRVAKRICRLGTAAEVSGVNKIS